MEATNYAAAGAFIKTSVRHVIKKCNNYFASLYSVTTAITNGHFAGLKCVPTIYTTK